MKTSESTIVFDSRQEMVKEIVQKEFAGICVDRPADPIFRRTLAVGAFGCWQMYGFSKKDLIKKVFLDQKDAMSIYWAFRSTGFLKALDALATSEHSWGWSFYDLDLLEELISLVQSKLNGLPEEYSDSNAWGALNVFKTFLSGHNSINVMISNIPCVCAHCLIKNPGLYFKKRKEIRELRKNAEEILLANVTDKDIEETYETCRKE